MGVLKLSGYALVTITPVTIKAHPIAYFGLNASPNTE
jgi:hypothetical protein